MFILHGNSLVLIDQAVKCRIDIVVISVGLPTLQCQRRYSKFVTYIKDIVERNKVKNSDDLEDLLDVISSSIGSLTNPNRIANTFKTEKSVDSDLANARCESCQPSH